MFAFSADPAAPKPALYRELHDAACGLASGECDVVANVANWAGFYRVVDDALVLGPFVGKPACIRIASGQGVCGAALASGETQLVADVHAFPGHIACDAESRAELVVPIIHDGHVVAVIDLDSPTQGRFDAEDAAGLQSLAATLAPLLGPELRRAT